MQTLQSECGDTTNVQAPDRILMDLPEPICSRLLHLRGNPTRSGSQAAPYHGNIRFYGAHSVNVAGELAKLGSDGYRPLRVPAPDPGRGSTG